MIPRLSYSAIDDLVYGCPYKRYLRSGAGLKGDPMGAAAGGGVAVHKTLERWMKGEFEPHDFLDVTDDEVRRMAAEGDLKPEEEEEALDTAEAAILNFVGGAIPEGQPGEGGTLLARYRDYEPIHLEHWWNMRMEPTYDGDVVGITDAVLRNPLGGTTLVDWKTAGRLDRYPLDGSGNLLQSGLYWMAERGLLKEPAFFEYAVMRTKTSDHHAFQPVRVIQLQPDTEQENRVWQMVDRAAHIIDAGEFPKNPDTWLCPTYCDYSTENGGPCNPDNPTQEIPVREWNEHPEE